MPMRTQRAVPQPRQTPSVEEVESIQRSRKNPRRRLTPKELAVVATRAGFGKGHNPAETIIAVAIALAESGGRVGAINKNSNGSTDRGLWQINSVHPFDARRLLEDPQYNADAAFAVFTERAARGVNGFEAWSAFRNKSYQAHRVRARLGVKAAGYLVQGPTGGNWATAVDEKVRDLNPFDFDGLANALWPVLLKTALAGTGLALIGYGVKTLFTSSAGSAAKQVAPVAVGVAREARS